MTLKHIALCLLAGVACSQMHSAAVQGFVVFDGTLYQSKPDLAQYGVKPITIIYTASLWNNAADRDKVPDPSVIRPLALQASQSTGIAVIDIEHWKLEGDSAADNIQKYVKTLQLFHQSAPSVKVGLYGVAPRRNYWDAIRGTGSPNYATWQRQNDSVSSIARQENVLFPSVYTFYKDQEGWQKYAIAQIQEARRIGPGKPVYLFLWPQFNTTDSGGEYLPPAYWRMELETARKYADGVVIWGGWQQTWDSNAPWWLETQKFLKETGSRR